MRLFAFLMLILSLVSCGRGESVENTNTTAPTTVQTNETVSRSQCLNLNTATAEELERLPGIGEVMARKIIEFREQNGPFRRPEEIIVIEGFSERKYRHIESQVCAY